MNMRNIITLNVLLCLFTIALGAFGPKKLYTMDIPTEAVSVKVIGRELFIIGPWYIGVISNAHWKFRQSSRMKPRLMNKDIPNPRSIGKIPTHAFKGNNAEIYWVATWGTNDTSGGINVLKPTTTYSVWQDITIDSGWNYERSQWIDMNRDGRMDCLTARFRGGVGQMLWFSQPAGQTKWGQHIIHEGMADGNFIGFVKGKKTYILVAGLQFSALGLYWTLSRSNLWSTSRMVRQRVIDNYGKFYDVQYVDLNRDGRPDVLTTTVNIGNSRGHVLGYEVPDDVQNKIWKRRVLAAGFQGDYSPGKATAFWPNKWKKRTDRPSVFLSGAGSEVLFILTPKPARSGWGFIKSSVKAGTGMIGLPFIGDIDGDSYPEVFVPQGSKLHVFSYDYNAAVAQPPATKKSKKVTPRPVVKYLPPFFRPTTPALLPFKPKGATPESLLPTKTQTLPPFVPKGGPLQKPVIPGSSRTGGGLSGNAASQFGSTGILPGSGGSRITSGASSNLPAPVSRTNILGNGNTGAGGGAGSSSSNTDDVLSQWPGSSNSGSPRFVPNSNSQTSPVENPFLPQGGATGGSSIVQLPGNNRNQPPAPSNNAIVPLGGDSSSEGGIYTNNRRITSDNNVVQIDGNQVPFRDPLEPVFEDVTEQPMEPEYYEDNEEPYLDTPANTVLTITSAGYRYREEAQDSCSFEGKVLCSVEQLEAAKSAGPIPLIDWGWFGIEGRAAQIQDCLPGEVKWPGFKCHNGVVGHLPVQQTAELQGFCCSILQGVNVTNRRFSNHDDAQEGCSDLKSHLCSLQEMLKVWELSSYKSDTWGWYDNHMNLIKMVYTCESTQALWPGYECHSRKLATSTINSHVQESAYCCPNSAVGMKLFGIATSTLYYKLILLQPLLLAVFFAI